MSPPPPPLPACKYGANCYQKSSRHFTQYSHPSKPADTNPSNTRPACQFGSKCYRMQNSSHVAAFSHPGDSVVSAAQTGEDTDEDDVPNKSATVNENRNIVSRDSGDDVKGSTQFDDDDDDDFGVSEDELANISGIKPLILLKDGEEREVESSRSSTKYKIKRTYDHYYCTCQGWRIQSRSPINARTCKHLKELLGQAYETARLKMKNPDGEVSTKPATKKPKKSNDEIDDDDGKGKSVKSGIIGKQPAPKLLLAHSYTLDIDPTGWWMSEKLDGVRALWDPTLQTFLSRTGNPFFAPKSFTAGFPSTMQLDGELFAGRGKFNSTVSIVRTMNSPNWESITFRAFDIPSLDSEFEERLEVLRKWVESNPAAAAKIQVVEHVRVTGSSHITRQLAHIESLGGEGLMLRAPKSLYEGKRSKTLLKVKSFYDAEAVVTGYEPGKGKHKGVVGALKCRMESGKIFKIGTGMSDAERKVPPKVGDVVTYRFQELTPDGIPRFPSYVGIRIDANGPKDAVISKGNGLLKTNEKVSKNAASGSKRKQRVEEQDSETESDI